MDLELGDGSFFNGDDGRFKCRIWGRKALMERLLEGRKKRKDRWKDSAGYVCNRNIINSIRLSLFLEPSPMGAWKRISCTRSQQFVVIDYVSWRMRSFRGAYTTHGKRSCSSAGPLWTQAWSFGNFFVSFRACFLNESIQWSGERKQPYLQQKGPLEGIGARSDHGAFLPLSLIPLDPLCVYGGV